LGKYRLFPPQPRLTQTFQMHRLRFQQLRNYSQAHLTLKGNLLHVENILLFQNQRHIPPKKTRWYVSKQYENFQISASSTYWRSVQDLCDVFGGRRCKKVIRLRHENLSFLGYFCEFLHISSRGVVGWESVETAFPHLFHDFIKYWSSLPLGRFENQLPKFNMRHTDRICLCSHCFHSSAESNTLGTRSTQNRRQKIFNRGAYVFSGMLQRLCRGA